MFLLTSCIYTLGTVIKHVRHSFDFRLLLDSFSNSEFTVLIRWSESLCEKKILVPSSKSINSKTSGKHRKEGSQIK